MDRFSIRDLLTVLFKRWKLLVTMFLVIVGTVTLANVTATPYYESEAAILLKFGREHVVNNEVSDATPQVGLQTEELITSELEILRSVALARETVSEIGWKELYPGIGRKPDWTEGIGWVRYQLRILLNGENEGADKTEMAAIRFSQDMLVEPVAKSQVVVLNYMHWDAETAAKAVNTHIEKFKIKRLEVFSDPNSDFLQNQLQLISAHLQDAERRYDEFRQKYGVFDLDQQQQLLLERQSAIRAELDTTQGMIAENTERLASLTEQARSVPKMVQVSSASGRTAVNESADSTLYQLRLRREELLTKYRPNTPFIQDIDRQIREAQRLQQQQRSSTATGSTMGTNPLYEQIQSQLSIARADKTSLAAKEAALRTQLAQVDERLQTLDERYGELQMLTREVQSAQRQFESYEQKVLEAQIAENANRDKQVNVSVIGPAHPAQNPSEPRKTLNIALAIMFSIGFGVALAFLLEHVRSGFATPEMAARRLGMPMLGSIPYQRSA